MGQAFDSDGNVLGEAYGATKKEVFDKLNAEFKQAAEIRIRSMEDSIRDARSGGAMTPVPINDPLMRAWMAYKASEAFANTKSWITRSPSGGDGELWAAFEAGWHAREALEHTQPAGDLLKPGERDPRD